MKPYTKGMNVNLWALVEHPCGCCVSYHYFGQDGVGARLDKPKDAARDDTARALWHLRKELRAHRAMLKAVANGKATYIESTETLN